ncbi:MAG: hypothetical protein L3K08_05870 [Thermoplasmata archaeon]|nr:hypothetical protein [Thermoplasmata archaeon]
MSEHDADAEMLAMRSPRETVLNLYAAILGLMLVGIGILTIYILQLGSLVGPGVEQSFGFAVALMFLMAALMVHTAEATYRLWPLGRRFQPTPPGPVSDRMISSFLKILVVILAVGVLAYLIAGFVM